MKRERSKWNLRNIQKKSVDLNSFIVNENLVQSQVREFLDNQKNLNESRVMLGSGY